MTKREQIDKLDLLYDPAILERVNREYGPASEIKHYVKTAAKLYEIRTALRFWSGGEETHRTSHVLWLRLEAVDDGVPPEEAERL